MEAGRHTCIRSLLRKFPLLCDFAIFDINAVHLRRTKVNTEQVAHLFQCFPSCLDHGECDESKGDDTYPSVDDVEAPPYGLVNRRAHLCNHIAGQPQAHSRQRVSFGPVRQGEDLRSVCPAAHSPADVEEHVEQVGEGDDCVIARAAGFIFRVPLENRYPNHGAHHAHGANLEPGLAAKTIKYKDGNP